MYKFILQILLVSSLMGCVYSNDVSIGRDFTTDQVNKIEKNVTTVDSLLSVFGEPAYKTVISENEEKWFYTYTGGTATAQAFTMKSTSNILTHMLDILIRDGVVINFVETNNVQSVNSSVK